jgi:hypothetical protein
METRVAMALSDASYNAKDGRGMPAMPRIQRGIDLQLARAAIRAMHTPTTEMLREAGMAIAGNTEAHATVWETMIDAASPQEE